MKRDAEHTDQDTTRRRGLWIRLAVVGVLLLASAGHWALHYRPRVRVLGDSVGAAGALWASSDAELALWLAYPHQNLGALERRAGDLDAYLADVATLLDDAALRLPRFGPFRFPPARELVAVEVPARPRWRAAAQVYPLVGLAARSAGRLTANSWLAGGEVSAEGSAVRIEWRGNLWSFGSWQPGQPPDSGSDEGVLARLRLSQPRGEWPAGSFDLSVRGDTLWLVEHGVSPADLEQATEWPFLQGVALALHETSAEGRRALLFFDDGEGTAPSVASVAMDASRFDLPGERLFGRLGADVVEGREGRWTLAAYSETDLERARRRLDLFSGRTGVGRSARLAAAPVASLSRGLGEALAEIPILGEREARRWLALARLLEPLGENGVVEVSLAEPVYLRITVGR